MKTIVYQGAPGAYSHLNAVRYFGKENRFVGMTTFTEMFEAVHNGSAEYAVVPIENTLIGSIHENYDLLGRYELHINGETSSRIEHCLIGLPESSLEGIAIVYSHPKALEQCRRFLSAHPNIKIVSHYDTAGSVADIAAMNDPSSAAIAGSSAAEIYGMKVLEKNIEDNPENYTRFFLVSKKPNPLKAGKCTVSFTLDHRPGSLIEALEVFAKKGINLTKLESRPILGKPFEYVFYADLQIPGEEGLWEEVKTKVKTLKILGIYERF